MTIREGERELVIGRGVWVEEGKAGQGWAVLSYSIFLIDYGGDSGGQRGAGKGGIIEGRATGRGWVGWV